MAEPGRPSRREALVVVGLVVALVVCRVRLVAVFGGSWTDEDQALLWYAARDLAAGHLREPYFFGQPYGSWLEALVAVPLWWLGAPLRLALPAAASLVGTVPWVLFATVAWWVRRSAVLAAGILGAALAMSVEGSIVSTMPRGLLPGVVLGCVAVSVVLVWPASRSALAVFGFLLVVSASLNVGAGLVTGPVAVWVVVSSLVERPSGWVARLGWLGGGLVVGGGVHLAAQSFYRSHPSSDLHGTPAFSFSFGRLSENVGHLGRYLPAYAPEVWRSWAVAAVAVVLVAGWTVWRGRSVASVAAAGCSVVLAVAVLGTAKANDGVASIYFPFSRVYLGLPWMLCGLLLLPRAAARRSSAAWIAVAAVGVLCLAGAAVREVRLADRIAELVAAADGVPPVAPASTASLERACELRRSLARRHRVDVVLDRYDRSATYGCGAVLYGDGVGTLFPEYERRTWLFESARRRMVGRVLVSGLDSCPPRGADDCELVDEGERLYLLSGAPRTLTDWARDAGLDLRA